MTRRHTSASTGTSASWATVASGSVWATPDASTHPEVTNVSVRKDIDLTIQVHFRKKSRPVLRRCPDLSFVWSFSCKRTHNLYLSPYYKYVPKTFQAVTAWTLMSVRKEHHLSAKTDAAQMWPEVSRYESKKSRAKNAQLFTYLTLPILKKTFAMLSYCTFKM